MAESEAIDAIEMAPLNQDRETGSDAATVGAGSEEVGGGGAGDGVRYLHFVI